MLLAEALGTETVDLYAGEERKHYVVHKKLLTSKSDFFNKALNGSDDKTNSMHFAEDDPACVALLIGFLYNGTIPAVHKMVQPSIEPVSPASPSGSAQVSVNILPKGSIYPFRPTKLDEPRGELQIFQHISCQSEYLGFSPEEIRLADYNADRKYGWGSLDSLHAPSLGSLLAPLLQGTSEILMTTPQQLKEVKREDSHIISYPESAGVFIKGIPKSKRLKDNTPRTDEHQFALLGLCLLAERIHWPQLFNTAINDYVRSEFASRRPIPVDHADLIYGRSSADSALRGYAMKIISSTKRGYKSTYMPLAKKYEDFMGDLLDIL